MLSNISTMVKSETTQNLDASAISLLQPFFFLARLEIGQNSAYFSRLNGRKWQMIPTVTNVAEPGSVTIFYPDKALFGFFISVWDIVSRRHAKLLEHDQARCISRVALQAGFQVSDRLVGIPQCVIR